MVPVPQSRLPMELLTSPQVIIRTSLRVSAGSGVPLMVDNYAKWGIYSYWQCWQQNQEIDFKITINFLLLNTGFWIDSKSHVFLNQYRVQRKCISFSYLRGLRNRMLTCVDRRARVWFSWNNQGGAKEGKIDLQISESPFLRNMLKCYLNLFHEDFRNSFWTLDDIWGM